MTTIETPIGGIGRLRGRISGRVALPGDSGWDAARQAFNLVVDQNPEAIAFPVDEEDVAGIVEFAADNGLRVAAQRTGHNAAPLGPLQGTILLRTDALQGVQIFPGSHSARVRAGAKWADVVPRASELGLAALHGSTPDVSVVGYSLGGGMGWYARRHGLSANSVTAIELVTADGELVRTDPDNEPDLFWALRGGGGNFGVVTAMEFMLYPIAEVYAGALFFPFERSAEVLHAWRAWVDTVPDEITSVGRTLQFPPLPEVPEPMRGRSFAIVEAAYIGREADGEELLEPLRALGPAMDTFAMVPPVGLSELHMDPTEPMPFVSGHRLLGDLTDRSIEDLLGIVGPGSESTLIGLEFRHSGGAMSRTQPHHGAVATLPGNFVMFTGALALDPAVTAAAEIELGLVMDAVAPYEAGQYFNFAENGGGAARFFAPDTYRRLQEVKAEYDPGNLFRANHPIDPAG